MLKHHCFFFFLAIQLFHFFVYHVFTGQFMTNTDHDIEFESLRTWRMWNINKQTICMKTPDALPPESRPLFLIQINMIRNKRVLWVWLQHVWTAVEELVKFTSGESWQLNIIFFQIREGNTISKNFQRSPWALQDITMCKTIINHRFLFRTSLIALKRLTIC